MTRKRKKPEEATSTQAAPEEAPARTRRKRKAIPLDQRSWKGDRKPGKKRKPFTPLMRLDQEDVKTSAVSVHHNDLTPNAKEQARDEDNKLFSKVAGFTPTYTNGTPSTRRSAKGALHHLRGRVNHLLLYKEAPEGQNSPPAKPTNRALDFESVNDENDAAIINAAVPQPTDKKVFSFDASAQTFKDAKEYLLLHGRDQQRKMGKKGKIRAEDYARAAHFIEYNGKNGTVKRRIEWVHQGVPAKAAGQHAQHSDALICDTFEMNNWFVPGESAYDYLKKKFPEGFRIRSEAEMEKVKVKGVETNTHIAKGIVQVHIETKSGYITNFNVHTEYRDNNPHKDFVEYVFLDLKRDIEKWEALQNKTKTVLRLR